MSSVEKKVSYILKRERLPKVKEIELNIRNCAKIMGYLGQVHQQ